MSTDSTTHTFGAWASARKPTDSETLTSVFGCTVLSEPSESWRTCTFEDRLRRILRATSAQEYVRSGAAENCF